MATKTNVHRAILPDGKFQNPLITANGKNRAHINLKTLRTIWFNTGTLCNLTCHNCYIESSPTNDRLVYLTVGEVTNYLDEIKHKNIPTSEIGFTGGEPFMNPDFIEMLAVCFERRFRVLILTNGMRPMMKVRKSLANIQADHGKRLIVRVSLDHYTKVGHELERGENSWVPVIDGLLWLSKNQFNLNVAGRTFLDEKEEDVRRGYAHLFKRLELEINADDPAELVLFPEMDASLDIPEITTECWQQLDVDPDSMMCASSRMVVKRKGALTPNVVACTLLAYDQQFELGQSLSKSRRDVLLNHPHCARFCVLGGASCSQAPKTQQ